MGRRIPDSIRNQAIKKWLEGRSRDKIAKGLEISQGAVSGIINDAGKNDPQFLLLREVAVKIRNQGMDIESFAPLVRLRTVLRDKGVLTGSTGEENLELVQNRFEAAVISIDEFVFHKELSPEDYYSLVTDMYNLADKVGVPLNEFPPYIKDLEHRIDVLREDIDQEEKKKQDFQNNNKETLDLLQEFIANKPFLITLQNLKEQLADANGRIRELEEELENERRSNDLEEQNSASVFETKLEKAKEEILPDLEIPGFMDTIKDVFRHPERYMGSINRMMNIYAGYQEVYLKQTNFSIEAN